MPKPLVECVPNFSEGRDKAKVEQIVAAARAVPGVAILDVETDADHHRCVLSFVAPPEAALEACFQVAQKSRDLIDLTQHKGEHPRMGAVDVIPFIPVSGIDIKECAALAERLGERIGRELGVPVYLYDQAARRPERKDLAAVRKGQFEGLRELIGKDPERTPDFGPNKIHPTAGAVAVGARRQIINLNLNLDIHDMSAGKDIAKRVRASGGGLPCVRAKEIDLAARKQVQISTVLTDYKTTPMRKVIFEVFRLAKEHGATIKTSEIVGLLPREALLDFAMETLTLENFNPEVQILENRLDAVLKTGWQEAAETVGSALATTDATPGGGSAAAISGAMGCGLGEMAVGITLRSKKLDAAKRPGLEAALAALKAHRGEFHKLTADDAKAFDGFMAAMALPKDDPARAGRMQDALAHAAEVPLATARKAGEALDAVKAALPDASAHVISDMNCALHLLRAAGQCAAENVRINLDGMKDPGRAADLKGRLETALRALACAAFLAVPSFGADYDAGAAAARKLLEELVAADTTNLPGNEAKAVALGVKRLKAAKIPYEVSEFAPGRQNLVARLPGSGQEKPLLLIAHTDVVGASGQSWTVPPHQVTEKDGYLYGRGVLDDLGMAAVALQVLELLKKDGTPLRRDVILAWTGDEESGGAGIQQVLKDKPGSISAALAINEGGGIVLGADGKPKLVNLQMAEKVYVDFELSAEGPTGHSSVPLPDNAIVRLARALDKVGARQDPARLIPITKGYLEARAQVEAEPLASAMRKSDLKELEKDPSLSALLRTTCVATLVSGGTRVNALPAKATANLNCRVLPDEEVEAVRQRLIKAIGDPKVEVKAAEMPGRADASPVDGEGPKAIRKVLSDMGWDIPIIPVLSRGATDSRFLRGAGIPAYGFNTIGGTEEDHRRAHGIDERIPAASIRSGLEILHKLVLELAAQR